MSVEWQGKLNFLPADCCSLFLVNCISPIHDRGHSGTSFRFVMTSILYFPIS